MAGHAPWLSNGFTVKSYAQPLIFIVCMCVYLALSASWEGECERSVERMLSVAHHWIVLVSR